MIHSDGSRAEYLYERNPAGQRLHLVANAVESAGNITDAMLDSRNNRQQANHQTIASEQPNSLSQSHPATMSDVENARLELDRIYKEEQEAA